MTAAADSPLDSVGDDEWIYRRVPASKYRAGRILADYMLPHVANDRDGMSFSRALFESAEEMVRGAARPGAGVFAIRASVLLSHGLTIVPSPTSASPGHCHIPELNSSRRGDDAIRALAVVLAAELAANPIIVPQE